MWFSLLFAAVAAQPPAADGLALNPELPLTSCSGAGDSTHVAPGTSTTLEGTLAGTIEANTHVPSDMWCSGYVPLEPQHCLVVTAPLTVTLEVIDASGIDSVLVVQDADGQLVNCDDDGGTNLLSRLDLSVPPGTYRVSVGSFGSGHEGRYRMTLRTR